jgi:hypothetical protein
MKLKERKKERTMFMPQQSLGPPGLGGVDCNEMQNDKDQIKRSSML